VIRRRARRAVGAPSYLQKAIFMSSAGQNVLRDLADTLHVFRAAGGLVASQGHKDTTREIILTEAIGV